MREALLIAGLVALFLGWNVPNHYPLWTTFHGELASAVGVCLLFSGAVWPRGRTASTNTRSAADNVVEQRLALPLAARVWLAIALLPVLQFALGKLTFRGDAALGFLYAAGVAMSLYVGQLWAAQVGRARVLQLLCSTVVLGAVTAAGLALVQWLHLQNPGWWAMELIGSRPFGNFAQPNLFGLLMVMGIVAASALFEMRLLVHRPIYALTIGFLGFGMLACESRAAILGSLSIAVFWFLTRRQVPTRLHAFEVLAAILAGLVVYKLLGDVEGALNLTSAAPREMLEAGPREWIWRHFCAAIIERPWTGYGFGQGVEAMREVAARVHPSRNSIYAHNLVLDLMTWFGIPAALMLTVALVGWMLGWLRKTGDVEALAQRHWVFAMWLGLLVQSLLEFPFAHAFFLVPAALLAGAVTPLREDKATTEAPPRRASSLAIALGGVCIALLALLTYDYFRLEDDFRANRYERANFVDGAAHEPYERVFVLDQFAALNATAHYKIRPGMSASELAQLEVVARRFHLLPVRMDYAKALALNGRLAEAQDELARIRGLYFPTVYARIDRDWQMWLKQNEAMISPRSN